MAKITDFDQDDSQPFGVGMFRLDDGSEHYLDHPQAARDFLSQYKDESRDIASSSQPLSTEQRYSNAVAKLAGGPNAPQLTPKAIDADTLNPMRRAVAGPGGGEDDASLSSQPEPDENKSSPDNFSRDDGGTDQGDDGEDADGAAPARSPSEEEARNAAAAQRVAGTSALVSPYTKGVDRSRLLRMQQEGVTVPKSETRKGGLPAEMYNTQSSDRATAYNYTNDVLRQNQETENAAKLLQHEQLIGEALQQKQLNDKQAQDVQRKQTKYEQDRAWLDHEVDGYYDKHKPDPDRIFKERGVFGNIASAVAQFMGAYASIVSGSPNFASQILDKKIERDVDSQIEDFRRGKMKLDGQLQRMAERGMTIDQMKAGLRLQQEKVIEKEAKAAALAEGTRESMAAYQALIAQRQETYVKEENKFRTEALGENTVTSTVEQPQDRRLKTPVEQLKERRDLLKTENELGYEAGGGAPQERADIRTDKRAATAATAEGKKATAETKRLTDYGNRRGVLEPASNEAQKARDRLMEIYASHGNALPGVGQFDLGATEGLQSAGTALGSGYMKDAGEVKQLLSIITGAAVRANKGSQTEGDVAREVEAMTGPNQTEEQVLKGVERLTQRAVTPLDDLNATYSDVLPAWRDRQDQTLLDKHKRKKEQDELRQRGKVY